MQSGIPATTATLNHRQDPPFAPLKPTTPWRYSLCIATTAIAYYLGATLSMATLGLGAEIPPVWYSAGIALAALLLQGQRAWIGVVIGAFLSQSLSGHSWPLAAGFALGSGAQAVVASLLLQRFKFRISLERLRDALSLIVLGAFLSTLISPTLSMACTYLAGEATWREIERNWVITWLSNGMGVLVTAPLLLTLRTWILRYKPSQRLLEGTAWIGITGGIGWVIFHAPRIGAIAQYPLEYFPFPLVIWSALRFGQPGATLAGFLVANIALWGTLDGYGPLLTNAATIQQLVLNLQAFIGVLMSTALVLAAAVAEQSRTEDLLRRSEASLANAQRIARLGHWDFEFASQQWRWSDELYRLLGIIPKAIAPNRSVLLQSVHPEDREQVQQAMDNALINRMPYEIRYRIVSPDGAERIVDEQVVVWASGITGTVQDITARHHAEEQLRLRAERDRLLAEMGLRIRQSLDLEAVLNTTVLEVRRFLQADRVFISHYVDSGEGEVVAESVGPSWASALGWTTTPDLYPELEAMFGSDRIRVVNDTTQVEKSPFLRLYHDQFQVRASIAVPIMRAVRDASPQENRLFGLLVVNQCSTVREWQPLEIDLLEQLATQVAIAIQQGQLYQQVQSLNASLERQVTERTEQLQQKMQELQELNQLRDVFLHAVSHDLRTTVMGSLLVFKNLKNQPGETVTICQSMLDRMIQCGEIQLNKLNALLEAYVSKTQGIQLDYERIPMPLLVQTVLTDLELLFTQNRTVLHNQVQPGLPLLSADLRQVRRVFEHLLTNAVKHNPPGVEITINATVEAERLHCTVADNGVGISPEKRDRLFELRIGNEQSRQLTGIGLGLFLCHQIVVAHGGEMGVTSTPEQGSCFWFTLPLAATNAALPKA